MDAKAFITESGESRWHVDLFGTENCVASHEPFGAPESMTFDPCGPYLSEKRARRGATRACVKQGLTLVGIEVSRLASRTGG